MGGIPRIKGKMEKEVFFFSLSPKENTVLFISEIFWFWQYFLKSLYKASKMTKQVKVLASNPDCKSSIPRTHMMGRENWLLPQAVL